MTSPSRTAKKTALALLVAAGGATRAASEEPASQYSPLAQIRRDNVATLEVAWTYRTGEPLVALPGGGRPPAFEATPLYAFGLLYIGTPYGKVIALEPETGKERWSFDAKVPRDGNFGDFASRGVSAWQDEKKDAAAACREQIFFASIDARLVALDAKTGTPCAGFGTQGVVDLKAGLRRRPDYLGEYEETSPPAVIDDLVVIGSGIADNNRANAPTGEVRAFDARSGALRWTFDPLPDNPAAGGANAWSRIVVDAVRHLVFVPTGSPSPDYYGGLRPGANRYANSVVALRAATGAVVWHFQTVHHDLWDYDVATPPALFTTSREGQALAGVAVGSKTGHLFLLDRETGRRFSRSRSVRFRRATSPARRPSERSLFPRCRWRSCRSGSRPTRPGARTKRIGSGAASRSRRFGPRASSRRRASAARSWCRATSAGCTGAAWRSRARKGC